MLAFRLFILAMIIVVSSIIGILFQKDMQTEKRKLKK